MDNKTHLDFVERLKFSFDDMVVYKDLKKSNFISTFKLPSFMRDFVLKKFQDEDGIVDVEEAVQYIRKYIPKSDDWKSLQNRIIYQAETIKILAKITINIDIATGVYSFSLPDFGLGFKDTVIPSSVWSVYGEALLHAEENWGLISLSYQYPDGAKQKGKIRLESYADFCPYNVDLDEFRDARETFSIDEWIDIVLGAVDYNPSGYKSRVAKLEVIKRLLPFAEKRINLLELAPPQTGKSYLFGQVSRYGWLVSGKVQRAKLIYDLAQKKEGIVANHDFVALDEIREAVYLKDPEVQSALQAIMENGKYCAADGHIVNVDAGIIFLGNIVSEKMDEYNNMLTELPRPFQQTQFLDRIHGFIKGWDLPTLTTDMIACNWALNSEYFCSIMHLMREDPIYRSVVENLIIVPQDSDKRDTEAVMRMCTGYLKLLFPHVIEPGKIAPHDFYNFCLFPSMQMRAIIRKQMSIVDPLLQGKSVPNFGVVND